MGRAETRLQTNLSEGGKAEDDEGGDEVSECMEGVDLCEWPGKDQGGILGDDGIDADGESINEEDEYYCEGRIAGPEKCYNRFVGCVPCAE